MRSKKYPLEPLARVRAGKVDDAARELAGAIRAREAAEERRQSAEGERDRAAEAARLLRESEREALERGALTAGDMMRGDAWEARAKEEEARLARKVADEKTRESAANATEGASRSSLAGRKSESEVVEKDRDRWDERQQREREASDEEAAAEAWRPKPA